MAMTPEGRVKKEIRALLVQYKCWFYMPVPGGYGEPSLDYLCAYKGKMFAVEAKAPGKRKTLTPRQQQTINKMHEHDIPTFVCDGNTDEFEQWLVSIIV